MLGHTPCPVHAGIDMATAADGMHPTAMHSCLLILFHLCIFQVPRHLLPADEQDDSQGGAGGRQLHLATSGSHLHPLGHSLQPEGLPHPGSSL